MPLLQLPASESSEDLFRALLGTRRGSDRPPEDPRAQDDFLYSRITDEKLLEMSANLPTAPWQKGTHVAKVKFLLAGPRWHLPLVGNHYTYASHWLGIGPSRPHKKECLFILLNLWHDKEGNLAPDHRPAAIFRQASDKLSDSLITAKVQFALDQNETQHLLSPGVGPTVTREQAVQAFRERLEAGEAPSSPAG